MSYLQYVSLVNSGIFRESLYTFPLQKTKVLVTFNALQHFQETAYLTYQLFIGPLIWSEKLMAIFEFFPVLSRCNSNSKPHFGPY